MKDDSRQEGLDTGDSVSEEPSPEEAQEAWEGEGGSDGEKVNWDEPSVEHVEGEEPESSEAGVQIGLGHLGPVVVVTQADGKRAEKTISLEECFILSGQLNGMGAFMMMMQMQAQMQEAARIQAMMQQREKRSDGGVILG